MGGLLPFSCLDNNCKDIHFISKPVQLNEHSVYIVVDALLHKTFSPIFLNPGVSLSVILLTHSFSAERIRSLLPSLSNLLAISCFKTNQQPYSLIPQNEVISMNDLNPAYVKIDIQLLATVARISEKMSFKRSSESISQGFKRIVCEDGCYYLGDVVEVNDCILERVKDACVRVGFCIGDLRNRKGLLMRLSKTML